MCYLNIRSCSLDNAWMMKLRLYTSEIILNDPLSVRTEGIPTALMSVANHLIWLGL